LTSDGTNWTSAASGGSGTNMFSTSNYTFATAPVKAQGSSTVTGAGVISDDQGVKLSSGGSGADTAVFWMGNFISSNKQGFAKNISVRMFINTISTSTNAIMRHFAVTNDTTVAGSTEYMGFRINNTTVRFVSKDGTTEQTTDVSATWSVTTNGGYVVDSILTANTNAKGYVDGVLVATHSTNYPPASDTTAFQYCLQAVDSGGDASAVQFRFKQYVFQRAF
jgi:hypothetical protein